ncbi:MAG: CoA transferase [Anaerolineales bacterium]|nr:CoA transferase [Anaerolineales bacterium]
MPLLSNLVVLSLEQATTLPFLTQRLAREGARIIRIEPPGRGDPNRHVGRDLLGEAAMNSYYLPNNCGKQSITLNLAHPEGRALLHDLITRLPVDVFATNNRPSTYARLGIAYDHLSALRPGLIWLGITGFGPDSDEAAYDPVVQARAGWMALTGEPDQAPLVFGLPMVDLGASEHAYGALMKALYRRAVTGEGSRLDIALLYSAASWMASPYMLAGLGEPLVRRGNTHQFFAPVSVYPTADGFVYIAVGNDGQWEALTRAPGLAALADPAYQRNAGRIADVTRLNERLSQCTARQPTAALTEALTGLGVPIAPVHTLAEVWADPLLSRGRAHARDPRSGLELALPPLAQVGGDGLSELSFPPRLGEHNDQIYGELLGRDSQALAQLRQAGVI